MTLLQWSVLLGSLVAIVAWPQILRALGLNPIGAVAWLATVAKWIVVFLTVLMSFALTFNSPGETRSVRNRAFILNLRDCRSMLKSVPGGPSIVAFAIRSRFTPLSSIATI
jgi:hypothetical protein